MIKNTKRGTLTQTWVMGVFLTWAMLILPMGTASGQPADFVAVGERLVEAIEAGEITADQAQTMMSALARSSFEEEFDAAEEELIEKSYKESKWNNKSKRHGDSKWKKRSNCDVKESKWKDHKIDKATIKHWEEVWDDLKRAVKDGKLTQEEANDKMRAIKKAKKKNSKGGCEIKGKRFFIKHIDEEIEIDKDDDEEIEIEIRKFKNKK